MNPFLKPDQTIDLHEFLARGPQHTEILFKEFFSQQIAEERKAQPSMLLKIYRINRYSPSNNVEIIQAYSNSQAAYLFLLYETKYYDSYPFTERLQECIDLGSLTPYDIYLLTIDNIFDKDMTYSDYLTEIDSLVIVHP
jgi:hypothetical protein